MYFSCTGGHALWKIKNHRQFIVVVAVAREGSRLRPCSVCWLPRAYLPAKYSPPSLTWLGITQNTLFSKYNNSIRETFLGDIPEELVWYPSNRTLGLQSSMHCSDHFFLFVCLPFLLSSPTLGTVVYGTWMTWRIVMYQTRSSMR